MNGSKKECILFLIVSEFILGNLPSKLLKSYYLGIDHPFKVRILSKIVQKFGIRLTVPYEKRGWITLNITDGVEDGILRNGFYEPEVWESLLPFAKNEEIFWDIGANIGGVSLRAGLNPLIKEVHSFEPNSRTRKILLNHVALNPKSPITVHAVALSDKDENRELALPPDENSGVASLVIENTNSSNRETVQCIKIDSLIRAKKLAYPSLIKIDVEGWELPVLVGAKELFKNHPPKAVVFETLYRENEVTKMDPAISNFFLENGYKLKHIARSYDKLETVENFLAYRSA